MMLGWLKRLVSTPVLKRARIAAITTAKDPYRLRAAVTGDVPSIARTLDVDAHHGHFLVMAPAQWIENAYAWVVKRYRPGTPEPVQAFALEYANALVAFSIVAPAPDALARVLGPLLELHVSAVLLEHRGRGHANVLTDRVLARLRTDITLFARCLPASTVRKHMLIKRGFQELYVDANGVSWLFRGDPDHLRRIKAKSARIP